MSIETIKCRECGSADVTEFKPGSYVCGHCEAIFKHVQPATGAWAGGCEVDNCGVPALGRCYSCKRRFCRTHQATRESGHGSRTIEYTDWCQSCQVQEKRWAESVVADVDEASRKAREEWEPKAAEVVARVSDPVERLLRTMISEITNPTSYTQLARLLDPFPADREIADWFLSAIKEPPPDSIEVTVRRGGTFPG